MVLSPGRLKDGRLPESAMSFSNKDFISTGPDKVPEIGLLESVRVRSAVLFKRLLGVVPEITLSASSRVWSSVAWDRSGRVLRILHDCNTVSSMTNLSGDSQPTCISRLAMFVQFFRMDKSQSYNTNS